MKKKSVSIGIPRSLLYYRYREMWEAFFHALDCEVVLSPETTKRTLTTGSQLAVDEFCLSSKLFLGHVDALLGKCDLIFVPRVANYGRERIFCTKFTALPDIVANTFREQKIKLLTCNLDLRAGSGELSAFMELGKKLHKLQPIVFRAYQLARRAEELAEQKRKQQLDALLTRDGLKILLVGHSYNVYDRYVGRPVLKTLSELGATVIPADLAPRGPAVEDSYELSQTMPWLPNRELTGAVWELKDRVDGIILMSAFPCGPDSMVNDILMRRVKGIPMLLLTVDGQDGTAGLETRLESFVDILHFRKGEEEI